MAHRVATSIASEMRIVSTEMRATRIPQTEPVSLHLFVRQFSEKTDHEIAAQYLEGDLDVLTWMSWLGRTIIL
ncbi:hypothetical protein C3L21_36010 (plasmid) [Sinorhizobium meliloti]|nr:hypothetical protein C3L21_36010 [Sinorhizobium meliloti]